jgi:hypothetical protein
MPLLVKLFLIIMTTLIADIVFSDAIQLITAAGLMTTAAVGVLTYLQSRKNNDQQVATHNLVNSQSQSLLALTRVTSHAEGVAAQQNVNDAANVSHAEGMADQREITRKEGESHL